MLCEVEMSKMAHTDKSKRNKTIDFALESDEGQKYLSRCATESDARNGDHIDAIICADTFEVCRTLPRGSVDLLIVDPPYNLAKNYHTKQQTKL